MRTLETIIRLATAYSKLRMSKTVTPSDIDVAVNLIHLSIFGTEMVDDDEAAERVRVWQPIGLMGSHAAHKP